MFRNITKDLDTIIGKLATGDLIGDNVPKVKIKEIGMSTCLTFPNLKNK